MHRAEGLTISAHTERKNGKPLEIRGVNMDFQPPGVFVVPYVVLFQPFGVASASRHDTLGTRGAAFAPEDTLAQIKGLDLRLMGAFPTASLNGLGMTAGVSTFQVQRGAAISVFGNFSEELHGLQLALWANNASSGKGVQIGPFKKSEQCDCVQFGLLNRNAKRLRPFVNWYSWGASAGSRTVRPLTQGSGTYNQDCTRGVRISRRPVGGPVSAGSETGVSEQPLL
jgi:hypothetical protein